MNKSNGFPDFDSLSEEKQAHVMDAVKSALEQEQKRQKKAVKIWLWENCIDIATLAVSVASLIVGIIALVVSLTQ